MYLPQSREYNFSIRFNTVFLIQKLYIPRLYSHLSTSPVVRIRKLFEFRRSRLPPRGQLCRVSAMSQNRLKNVDKQSRGPYRTWVLLVYVDQPDGAT